MNHKPNHPSKTLLTLALCSAIFTAEAQNPPSAEPPSTITGSRIAGLSPAAVPVQVYSRQDLLDSGFSHVADFIRNLPENTGGSFRPQSGSSAQAAAVVSLRQLGSSRNLVLLNGRRLGVAPTTGSGSDLNVIPMAAVDRIEILRDGASAIYGSDAHTGVINVITRSDFEGVELSLGGAEPSVPRFGGEQEFGSVLFGSQGERSSLLAGVSWNDRELILLRDLPWTQPEFSLFGNNFTTTSNGFDNFDFTAIPGGCDEPDSGFILGNFGSICGYDFTSQTADEAAIENQSMFADASHQINDNWTLSARAAFRQTESFGQYAPAPGTNSAGGRVTVNSPNNPTNPDSPLYDPALGLSPQPVNWWHRFAALGNRETTVTTQQQDFNLQLTGRWLEADWTFGWRQMDHRSADVGRNFVLLSAAEALIESGEYDLGNPFGASQAVLNSIRTTIYREARYDVDEAFANARFEWLSLPAGQVTSVLGLEYRKEQYLDQYDPQSEAGQILGSAGNSAGANRTVRSAFMETQVPLFDSLDLRLAARDDGYSGQGDAFTSHIALHYQPLESLSFRFGFSDNARGPSLDLISQKPTSVFQSYRDPNTCIYNGLDPGCSIPTEEVQLANPLLEGEASKQFSLGVHYQPADWLLVDLNLYDLNITNRIRSFTGQSLINAELNGDPLPPGLGCQRAPSGFIIRCVVGFGNQGRIDAKGADLTIASAYRLGGVDIEHRLLGSYMDELSIDGNRDVLGDAGSPAYRAQLNHSFSLGNWRLVLQSQLIAPQDSTVSWEGVPSWVSHDVQLTYHTPWQGQLTLGANNLAERLPAVFRGQRFNRDYDFNQYNADGRVVYARYTQTF